MKLVNKNNNNNKDDLYDRQLQTKQSSNTTELQLKEATVKAIYILDRSHQ